jgi:hypothetical protein
MTAIIQATSRSSSSCHTLDWFRCHGWDVTVTPSYELMASYGRTPPREVEDTTPHNLFVAAEGAES